MDIFKDQIEIIKTSSYIFSNPSKFIENFQTPKKNKEILITIDDGFESFIWKHGHILKKIKFHLYCLYQLSLLEKEVI